MVRTRSIRRTGEIGRSLPSASAFACAAARAPPAGPAPNRCSLSLSRDALGDGQLNPDRHAAAERSSPASSPKRARPEALCQPRHLRLSSERASPRLLGDDPKGARMRSRRRRGRTQLHRLPPGRAPRLLDHLRTRTRKSTPGLLKSAMFGIPESSDASAGCSSPSRSPSCIRNVSPPSPGGDLGGGRW